jgi:phosphopantothenoylcysteine decarboxylase/phosphopantothenate--cysteine ligase
MNEQMWRKPVVQRNLDRLRADGHGVVPPVDGPAAADGQTAVGAMPDIDVIFEWATHFVQQSASAHAIEGTDPLRLNDTVLEAALR